VAGDQEPPRSCQAPASAEAAARITRETRARKASAARAGSASRGGEVRRTSGIADAPARGGKVRPTSGIADPAARGGEVRSASRVTDATARGRRIGSATGVATGSSRRDQGRDATTRRAWCEGADTRADAVHGARGQRSSHPHRRPRDARGGASGDGRVRTSAEEASDTRGRASREAAGCERCPNICDDERLALPQGDAARDAPRQTSLGHRGFISPRRAAVRRRASSSSR
jgi:hypothetical protein